MATTLAEPHLELRRRLRISLLVQTANEWSRQVLRGVGEFAHEFGPWDFYIEPRGFFEPVSLPADWEGDGVIARVTDSQIAGSIVRAGLPAVNVSWLGPHSPRIPKVVSDERACAAVAAEHFLDRSFSSFAYVGPVGCPEYEDLLGAEFVRLLDESGRSTQVFDPQYESPDKMLYQLRPALGYWLNELPKPVAILAWSSQEGRQITAECESIGLMVPDDAAILCAEHDMLMSSLAPIPLSNIDQDPHRVGYEAGRLLMRLINGEPAPEQAILVPPRGVVQRRSTETWAVEDPVVAKALRFIRENAHHPIQVGDVWKAVGISRRVLENRFSEHLGRSPAAEIRRARLDIAKRLLLETNLSINRMAPLCGFNHSEVMIRCFRRELGVSPGEFRKQRRS